MPVPPPSSVSRAERLAAEGRHSEAVSLLDRMVDRGDPHALFTLAMWRLGGRYLPFDLGQARDLFQRSGEAGRRDAAQIHVNLLASGTGGPSDWPEAMARLGRLAATEPRCRAQCRLIADMTLTPDGAPSPVSDGGELSISPRVTLFRALFTAAECDYLARAAEPMLKPSVVVDERDGRQRPHPIRTSDGATFAWLIADPAIHALNRRIAAASGTRVEQGEPLQVLRYRPGQQYRNHYDAIAGLDNQRALTMLVYLNDAYQGGETRFVRTGLAVRGRKGDALLFRNILPDGRPDPMSEHAGLPVVSGTKLIASCWIRERPFAPPPPARAAPG